MIGQRDFTERSWRGETFYLLASRSPKCDQWNGTFSCAAGIVGIWTARWTSRTEWTRLTAVAHGRTHYRQWRRCWSRRTLPRLCRRFLADLERGDG